MILKSIISSLAPSSHKDTCCRFIGSSVTEILLHKGHNGVDATAGHEMLFSLKHSWIPYVCVAPENNWNTLPSGNFHVFTA